MKDLTRILHDLDQGNINSDEAEKRVLYLFNVVGSKPTAFEKQDLLRAYQAGAIEQKDNNLKSIDVVTLGNLQEDSQVWYERYIG